ncbi:MAG: Hsp33 family molecular chaperone HslO [Halothiobacillus sp.]
MSELTRAQAHPDTDQLVRFGLATGKVRGVAVSIDHSWQTAGEHHDYPPAVAQLLGQCVAAALTMVATLKFDGRLIMQFRGAGPVSLLVVQARSDLTYRVTAQWSDALDKTQLDQSIQVLFGRGQLALTLEPNEGLRYQSLVPIEGASIASALEGYFQQSEQLPTRLVLAADAQRAVGLLIQQVPGEGGTPMVRAAKADANFDHLSIMVDTLLTPKGLVEVQTTAVPTLLYRLFHQDALVLTQLSPVGFFCGCSRDGVGHMLRSLGRAELDAALRDTELPGYVSVRCEFCGTQYNFDVVDVEQLLLEHTVAPIDATRH